MDIDVFTFVAQIFNFALLVWLLRRFLYKPIRSAMQRREDTIQGRLEKAKQERAAAEELAEEYQTRLRQVEEEADRMLSAAREEADQLAARLTEELRGRMEVREQEWRDTLDRKTAEELRNFSGDVRDEITSTVRRVLRDLADTDLEERMIAAFLQRVRQLDEEEVSRLVGPSDDRPMLEVVTSGELDRQTRESLSAALREVFGEDARLTFAVDAERIAGVELRCHGHRLGWNLGDYVDSLDDAVRRRLETVTQPAAEDSASADAGKTRENPGEGGDDARSATG